MSSGNIALLQHIDENNIATSIVISFSQIMMLPRRLGTIAEFDLDIGSVFHSLPSEKDGL